MEKTIVFVNCARKFVNNYKNRKCYQTFFRSNSISFCEIFAKKIRHVIANIEEI